MAFSVDYDEACLSFDPTDADQNGRPDSVRFMVSGLFGFTGGLFDASDTDGELDIIIADSAPPFSPIPDGVVVEITFGVTCQATSGDVIAAVAFSTEPSASYSDPLARDVEGWTSDGSVIITGN